LVVPYEGPVGELSAGYGIPVFVKAMVHWIPGSSVSTVRRRLRHLYRFLRTFRERCRAIERLIDEHGIDLVYTNTVTCVEGAVAAKRTGKPHVWHIHEHILRNSELAPLLPNRIYCAAIAFLSRSLIFCSSALAKDYPNLSKKSTTVHNGLPSPPLRNRHAARRAVLEEFGFDSGVKLVAVVGALHPRKDHMTFLAAAEQVSLKVENAVFLIVGSGFESFTGLIRRRMKELNLDSRVKLLGWREDVQDLLAAVDVLVISSEQESFGLTAIEALAMETPVVATRCGGPEEILIDGETGFLVPVKDPAAMADAIVRLLLSPELARHMGARGRDHVSEFFGVNRYVQGIQRVIQEASSRQH
jgi:glycosyltransferase involved in cell wall biosynthesis